MIYLGLVIEKSLIHAWMDGWMNGIPALHPAAGRSPYLYISLKSVQGIMYLDDKGRKK
jgi:hypothetical protein